MTRIQRIEARINAQHFRVIAGFLSERAMERAAEGAIGRAEACAHKARVFNARARKLERDAKQPFVWEAR